MFNFLEDNNLFSFNFQDIPSFDLTREKDEDFKILDENNSSYLSKGNKLFRNIFILEKVTTLPKTNNNRNNMKNDFYYNYEKILKIFKSCKEQNFFSIIKNFKLESIIKIEENTRFNNKKKFKHKKIINNEKKITIDKKYFKRGRKKGNDFTKRYHNKLTSDNIIKKIKAKLFRYLIFFCNNILKSNNLNIELKYINYKIIDSLNKKKELELLEMPLKELISKDISPKYTCLTSDYNKKIIDHILKEEKDNEVLMYILNMTYREWINIFTLKNNIIKTENLKKEIYQEIEKNMPKIADLLNDIIVKDDDPELLTNFIFYLYNYEKWFEFKRNRRKKYY